MRACPKHWCLQVFATLCGILQKDGWLSGIRRTVISGDAWCEDTQLVFTASVPFAQHSAQQHGDGEDDEDPILSSVSPIISSISHLIEKISF